MVWRRNYPKITPRKWLENWGIGKGVLAYFDRTRYSPPGRSAALGHLVAAHYRVQRRALNAKAFDVPQAGMLSVRDAP